MPTRICMPTLLAREESITQVKVVSAASAETAANVQTVAAAAEQFSASIKEISRQVADSAEVSKNAVAQSNQTNASMLSLAEASKKIEQVVKLINTVASQTQLLALNATIEASRAGEAGKGFAVVASEVKGLSIQTATATKEISSQVAAIQGATQTAIERLEIISKTICDMNGVLESIATAVEQQSPIFEDWRSYRKAISDTTKRARNKPNSCQNRNNRKIIPLDSNSFRGINWLRSLKNLDFRCHSRSSLEDQTIRCAKSCTTNIHVIIRANPQRNYRPPQRKHDSFS
jgi:hypothetical protein